jgi:hypothetical protein
MLHSRPSCALAHSRECRVSRSEGGETLMKRSRRMGLRGGGKDNSLYFADRYLVPGSGVYRRDKIIHRSGFHNIDNLAYDAFRFLRRSSQIVA